MNKKILYLRTDVCEVQINVGGSIGHTQGVIDGFEKQKYQLIVFSSQMHAVLEKEQQYSFYPLRVWPLFYLVRWRFWYLRWRLESFFSTFFFFFQVLSKIKKHDFIFIYQRYSILKHIGLMFLQLTYGIADGLHLTGFLIG